MPADQRRHVVGNTFLDLVKFFKKHEKKHGPVPFSPDARALLSHRVVPSEWYRLQVFHELLRVLDELVIHGDEQRALEMGAAGGAAMRGVQKAYVVRGDAKSSVLAMRHGWRAHYDFGTIAADDVGDEIIRFTLRDYPDMPMVNGMTTAGWGVSAARAAGSTTTFARILERPWKGADQLVYDIHL